MQEWGKLLHRVRFDIDNLGRVKQRSNEVNVSNSSNRAAVKKRNWYFELLRIISMFLIVATHYFAEDNWAVRIDPSLSKTWGAALHETTGVIGQVGVALFVLISAYFSVGREFRVSSRLKKLWVQVFFYSVVCMVVYALLSKAGIHGPFIHVLELREIISSFLPITFLAYWFVSSFFVMTLLSPCLNRFIAALSEKELLVFTGICVYITFGWKYLNPEAEYFTDVLYFVTLYFIAACCKAVSHKIPHISWWMVLLFTGCCFLICWVGTYFLRQKGYFVSQMGYTFDNLFTAGKGASPIFAVAIATVIFLYTIQFGRAHDSLMGNFILASAPATFGVYLLHENFLLKPVLWHYVFLIPSGSGVVKLGVAMVSIVVVFGVLMVISYVIRKLIILPLISRIH